MFLIQYSLLQNNLLAVIIPCINIEKVNYIYTRMILYIMNYKIKFAMLRTELKSRDNKIICLIRDYTYLTVYVFFNSYFLWSIRSVTFFFSFQKYAKIASERFKDLPMSPAESFFLKVYWTEYVLRHNGKPHLKTQALNLTWYQ